MSRFFLPLILVGAAIGLFTLYTNPTYQSIKDLTAQNDSYGVALTKAQELRQVRDQLLAKRNSFSSDELTKLQHVLPDNLDNIRLIIDINNIASRHSLALTNVDLGSIGGSSNSASQAQQKSVGPSGAVGSGDVSFSVSTSNYQDFLAFLQDMEHSLRLVDVTAVKFSAGANSIITYTLTVRAYWLH